MNPAVRHAPAPGAAAASPFAPSDLRALAAGAASLEERFAGLVAPVDGNPDPAVAALFESWRDVAAGGDDAVFERVLDAYGVTEDRARRVIGAVEWPADRPLPAWVSLFAALAGALDGAADAASADGPASDKPALPFEGLFRPLIAEARRRRNDRAAAADLELLSPAADAALDRALLGRMLTICGRALNDRLNSYTLGLTMAGVSVSGKTPEQLADDFARQMRGSGLRRLLVERPVLARLVAVATGQWIEASIEFLERLASDLDGPIAALNGTRPQPRQVEAIGIGLSDLHNGGRSVIRVTFDNGLVLGYKPKDTRVDLAFHELLGWLEVRGAPPSAGAVPTQAGDGYGWVVWLTPEPCASETEAQTFFRRSGAMLCLLRMLQGNDFHFENVIAVGPTPYPVDLETVMHARQAVPAGGSDAEAALTAAAECVQDSPLAVGFLPQWLPVAGGGALLAGGLDSQDRAVHGDRNSGMAMAPSAAGAARSNVPRLNDRPLQAPDYEADILAGYREMFAFLRTHGPELAAPDGPLRAFAGVTIRPVLRATQLYAYLHIRSLGRKATVSGSAWSQHFAYLDRSAHGENGRALPISRVCGYERRTMANCDIPYFTASPASTSIWCGDGTEVTGYFAATCLDDVRARLSAADDAMLRRDELFITQALRSARSATETTGPERGTGVPERAERHLIIARAHCLARTLGDAAIRRGDASCIVGPSVVGSDERAQQVSVLGGGLLTGNLGIVLFLAATYRLTGDKGLRAEVDRLLQVSDLQTKAQLGFIARGQHVDLGLASGLGGAIYGLVGLSVLLDESAYADRAGAVAASITPQLVATDRNHSLFGGSAGLLIGLTALRRRGIDTPGLPACIDHLLEQQRPHSVGGSCWLRPGRPDGLTGLMQGSAGIALALRQAADLHREEETLTAVREACTYAQSMATARGGHADLRDADGRPLLDYANGAAGVGLAWSAMPDALGKTGQAEIARLAAAVGEAPFATSDDLFTGSFGRLLFLHRAAAQLGDRTLTRTTEAGVGRCLAQAASTGSFAWRAGADAQNPGLSHGAAGVGLALLHLAIPEQIPAFAALPTDFASFS